MKALTLWQPWASLVAVGAKRIETRSWQTSYRGPLAIHAAKFLPPMIPGRLVMKAMFALDLQLLRLPRGCVVATCDLVGAERIDVNTDYGSNLALGDFTPGRYAWHLSNVRQLAVPIPARGKQGLWNWDGEL